MEVVMAQALAKLSLSGSGFCARTSRLIVHHSFQSGHYQGLRSLLQRALSTLKQVVTSDPSGIVSMALTLIRIHLSSSDAERAFRSANLIDNMGNCRWLGDPRTGVGANQSILSGSRRLCGFSE